MTLLATQLLLQRILRKPTSGGGGGLDGIFEIECGGADHTFVDFYYVVNSVNVYIFRDVSVLSLTTVFTPYILPANFTEITFYVFCHIAGGNTLAYANLGSYNKTMTSGTNGITGDSLDNNTLIITLSRLRNSHQYLRLFVDPS